MNRWFRDVLGQAYRGSAQDVVRALRRAVWIGRRRAIIRRYLETHPVRRLQLGGGFHRPDGWLNSDFMPRYADTIFLDITAPFPFSNDTFDVILCEHLIEHVPYPAADRAVAECFRVLKPGGYLRIATPDLITLLSLYEQPQSAIGSRYSRWIVDTFVPFSPGPQPCYVVNNAFRNWGHEFLYDEAALTAMLTRHRFVDLKRQSPQSSSSRELTGVDFHGRCIGDADFNDFESMIVEARKPEGDDMLLAAE